MSFFCFGTLFELGLIMTNVIVNNIDSLKPEMLHVILPYSNYERWNSRPKIFAKTLQHLIDAKVSVTVVECVLGDRFFCLG